MPWCPVCERVIRNGGCGCSDIREPWTSAGDNGTVTNVNDELYGEG